MVTMQSIPGLYRDEELLTQKPGLLTGVPVFIGVANQGEFNLPKPLTLGSQFQSIFGDRSTDSYLSHAVQGFFQNGGDRCYVVRCREDLPALEALTLALEALTALDSIDLICTPDLTRQNADRFLSSDEVLPLQSLVLKHCSDMGDRFAILDSWQDATLDSIQQQQQQLTQQGGSDYGALYFPWVQVEQATASLNIPPCGHIAGAYARSDRAVGVHQTPANLLLEGVVNLSVALSDADQAALNPQAVSVNCLRNLPGRGIRIWGGRTLSQDSTWQYINVRRLFLTVTRWLEHNLAGANFEPNDFRLWVRIERELTVFCEALFRQGALQGNTVEEAFFVKCDAEINPPEVREAGQLVTEIGLSPSVPGEFVVVRLIHG